MKPLDLLKWAWPIEGLAWLVYGFALLMLAPEAFARLMTMTPFVVSLLTLQAGVAFGGPAIKRAQELKKSNGAVS